MMLTNALSKEGTTMGSFIGSIVLTSSDTARAAEFWNGALGYLAKPGQPEFLAPSTWTSPSTTGADHGAAHLHLDETDQVHIDLWVDDGDTVESEVERLLDLGATRVDWEYADGSTHVVLADPDGNLFCVCA